MRRCLFDCLSVWGSISQKTSELISLKSFTNTAYIPGNGIDLFSFGYISPFQDGGLLVTSLQVRTIIPYKITIGTIPMETSKEPFSKECISAARIIFHGHSYQFQLLLGTPLLNRMLCIKCENTIN